MKPHQPLRSIKKCLTEKSVPIRPVEVRSQETADAIKKRGNPGPSSTYGRVKSIDPAEVLKFTPTPRKDWSFDRKKFDAEVRRNQPKPDRAAKESAAVEAGRAAALALLAELGISVTKES